MNAQNIPGTIMPDTDLNLGAFSLIETLLSAAGGLSLSQLKAITGLEGSTIQNWVKRGWVPKSPGKKYNELQLARILLISALRDTMRIDKIVKLIEYVNVFSEKQPGETIRESRIYNYLCEAMRHMTPSEGISLEQSRSMVHRLIADYEGPTPDSKNRLERALTVMVLYCQAGRIVSQADGLLSELV